MPHREIKDGDEIFIRARALETCSDAIKAEIVDFPNMAVTGWYPASECAKAGDIGRLRRRKDRPGGS